MHSTKSSLLLLALAISASCVVATPQPELLDELLSSLNQTGQNIISGIVDASKNGTAIAGEFLESLKNSTEQGGQDGQGEKARRLWVSPSQDPLSLPLLVATRPAEPFVGHSGNNCVETCKLLFCSYACGCATKLMTA